MVAAKAARPAQRRTAVIVRAEDGKIEKTVRAASRLQGFAASERADAPRRAAPPQTRPAGKLYFGGLGASEQSLSYLDGSAPGDYGCAPSH